MKAESVIFLVLFVSVFLRCLQVLNLAKGQKLWTAVTSVFIAIAQLAVIKAAIEVSTWTEGLAFVAGGVAGSVGSLWFKAKFNKNT